MANIRYATILDAAAIANTHVASWQAAYCGQIPDNILDSLSVDEREKMWQELLENDVPVLVLEAHSGDIAGFLSYCKSRDEDAISETIAEISALHLKSSYWRQGFGRLLCNEAINELKKLGYSEVTLWVLDSNKQARQFYEAIGFINSADIKITQEEGYTMQEIRYRKPL